MNVYAFRLVSFYNDKLTSLDHPTRPLNARIGDAILSYSRKDITEEEKRAGEGVLFQVRKELLHIYISVRYMCHKLKHQG